MADTTTYFGNAVRATYPDGSLIIVNGRPLLIPEKNYSLQQQIDAARYQASRGLAAGALTKEWFLQHFPAGGSGDPQRQAGWSGGFDARFTDAGNYGYGLSAAAAGMSLDTALKRAAEVNQIGTAKPLPAVNERAIRQGYNDYNANLFPKGNVGAGQAYVESVYGSDLANAASLPVGTVSDAFNSHVYDRFFNSQAGLTDVQRYAKARWGDLNSPDAKAFMANFQQAFGGYPQHLDLNLLQPLPADGSIPSGKDVSLFVGRNGEVLMYPRNPAPGGTGALRGIYGLDGGPNGVGSTGLDFFRDGTPQPVSVQPHLATSNDPTGGIDVALPNGANEHWWSDPIDGFIRRQQDYAYAGRGYDTPSERLGHVPGGALGTSQGAPTRDGRSGNLSTSPDRLGTPNVDQAVTAAGMKPMRYLSGRLAPTPRSSPFDAGAASVPFDNNPLGPDQPSSQPQSDGTVAPKSVRALSSRFEMLNPGGARQGEAPTSVFGLPAQYGGQAASADRGPAPEYQMLPPPSVYGLPDPSANNIDDWFNRWIKPLVDR